MNDKGIIIRREEPEEYRTVENLVREAFWNVYRPGCVEHYLLHKLRDDRAFVPELDLVLELCGRVIGQIMYMRSEISADNGNTIPVMTFGPVCIHPDFQRRGYGKLIVEHSMDKAKKLGAGAVCIEGNIDFYGKSGFAPASAFGIRHDDETGEADSPFFLICELVDGFLDGITGVYRTPIGYTADEREAEKFDGGFPKKEKLILPGQLFKNNIC